MKKILDFIGTFIRLKYFDRDYYRCKKLFCRKCMGYRNKNGYYQ